MLAALKLESPRSCLGSGQTYTWRTDKNSRLQRLKRKKLKLYESGGLKQCLQNLLQFVMGQGMCWVAGHHSSLQAGFGGWWKLAWQDQFKQCCQCFAVKNLHSPSFHDSLASLPCLNTKDEPQVWVPASCCCANSYFHLQQMNTSPRGGHTHSFSGCAPRHNLFWENLCRIPRMLRKTITAIAQWLCLNTRSNRARGGPGQMLESPLSLSPTSLKFKWLHRTASASYQDGQWAGQFTSLKNNLIFLVELIRIPLPDSKLTDIKWIISPDFSALWDETSPLGSSSLCRSILQEICSDLTVLLKQEPVSTGQTLHFNSKYACVIFPRTCFHL